MVRVDTGGRDPSVAQYLIRGTIFLLVGILVLALLWMRYDGKFDSKVRVTAELVDVGDGLLSGADVRYNGFIVGSVADVETIVADAGDPDKRVRLEIDPDQANGIPGNTTVRTIPANLFGVNSVEIVQPDAPEGTLRNGETLFADKSAETVRLQDAQTQLFDLLDAVPPEDLGMVLTVLADALQDGGATFALFIGTLETYWHDLNQHFPEGAQPGFDDFAATVNGLSSAAPELLNTLGKSVVPALTITEMQRDLTALLSTSQGLLDETGTLFAKNGDNGQRLVGNLNTVLGAVLYDPDAMPQAVNELYTLANRVLGIFTGVNGRIQLNLGLNFGAYQKYTRQNCPVYNGGPYGQLRGPGCVGPGTGTGPTSSGPLLIYPSDGMQRRHVAAPAAYGVNNAREREVLEDALDREPTSAEELILGPLVGAVVPGEGAR